MHSIMVPGNETRAMFYRTNRQGGTVAFGASLDEIRRTADDLQRYFDFGLALANCIAVKIHGADRLRDDPFIMAREAAFARWIGAGLIFQQLPPEVDDLKVRTRLGQSMHVSSPWDGFL